MSKTQPRELLGFCRNYSTSNLKKCEPFFSKLENVQTLGDKDMRKQMAWENEEVVKGFFLFKKNKNSSSGKDIKAWKIFNLMRMVRI